MNNFKKFSNETVRLNNVIGGESTYQLPVTSQYAGVDMVGKTFNYGMLDCSADDSNIKEKLGY